MGLAEWWHYRNVPKPAEPPRLVLDLAAARLAGLGFRDGAEQVLARLGPPASYAAAQRGHWLYPALGLRLDVSRDGIESFAAATDPAHALGFRELSTWTPYAGELVLAPGRPARALASVREADVRAALGAPTEEEREDDQLELRYETASRGLDFLFGPEGALTYVEVEDLRD